MKILLWNINGIRAIIKKKVDKNNSFEDYLIKSKADIICFNETKITNIDMDKINILKNYKYTYHAHSTKRKGYSGVSIYSKHEPLNKFELPNDDEGRVVALEFNKFIIINVYQPNSGAKLQRLDYRVNEWKHTFDKFILKMKKIKPVILVGDMNVAHEPIDIKYPEKHEQNAGYTLKERNVFSNLINKYELIDSWRKLHPNKIEYTYFDYRTKARSRNAGWRLDYILVSKYLFKYIKKVDIDSDIIGSDHIPVIANFDKKINV